LFAAVVVAKDVEFHIADCCDASCKSTIKKLSPDQVCPSPGPCEGGGSGTLNEQVTAAKLELTLKLGAAKIMDKTVDACGPIHIGLPLGLGTVDVTALAACPAAPGDINVDVKIDNKIAIPGVIHAHSVAKDQDQNTLLCLDISFTPKVESKAAVPQAMKCPGSPALIHAGMEITATAAASCDDVAAEILARIAGQSTGKWHDPHHNGTYSVDDKKTLAIRRVTGDHKPGPYTDKQQFTLTDDGSNCKIEGCSESQVFSEADFGTNYCDLKMLYCGKADGCKVVENDFSTSGEKTKKKAQASVNMKGCFAD
jgi:hypothetical protein